MGSRNSRVTGSWRAARTKTAAQRPATGLLARSVSPECDQTATTLAGSPEATATTCDHERARPAWGTTWAQIPVDRGKPGSKLHLVCDGQGLPFAAAVTAANVNDATVFAALLDDVPAVRTPAGRRR